MYHYVREIKNSHLPNIKGLEVKDFERQLEYFSKNYNFTTIEEIMDSIESNSQIKNNSILLTFDDGFEEHYSNVYPILKNKNIQGVFFPPGKPIEEQIVLDVHKIHHVLAVTHEDVLVKEIFKQIKNNKEEFHLENPEEYFKKFAKENRFDNKKNIFVKRMLQRELPEEFRHKLINQLFETYYCKDEIEFSNKFYLNFEKISEMREDNMKFGSHSFSHYWFSHLNNLDLKLELEKSNKFLKKIIKNNERKIMCYPYGDYDQRTIKIINEQNYSLAMTTKVGNTILEKSNRFQLERFDTNDFYQ